ncbi:unnamed protein product [Moneuplotes crassus]|uniref:Uncharacterized protein n=1 Tax=Euplotes crassus TaxID=5936 RepID=A0AAD1U4D7_EUPCR|nr:unnamed protein product [Moneuplotes crassus]
MQEVPSLEYKIKAQKLSNQLTEDRNKDPTSIKTPTTSRNSFIPKQPFRKSFYNGKRRERKSKHGYQLPQLNMPSHKHSRNYHENEFTSNKEKIPANLSLGNFNHDSKKSDASNKNGKKETVFSLAERYKAIIAPSDGKKRPDPGSRNTLLKNITPEKVLKACKSQISSLKLLRKNTPAEIYKKAFSPSRMFIRKDSNSSKMKEKEVILNFITLNSQFHNHASEVSHNLAQDKSCWG